MKSLSIYLLFFLTYFSVQSQTFIPGGFVSGTWQASQSPYHIQGNIEIHYDSTLVIEPGVEVLFDGSYKLTVHGLLNASGTVADSILFTATDTVAGWQGIEFVQINEDLGISNVKYCTLTHGNKPSGYGGAIYVYQAENVLISNCLIEKNYAAYGGGIFINDGWIEIHHCKITHNRANDYAGGLACVNSRPFFWDLEVTHNISENAGGIYFENCPTYSYPFFEDLNISNNTGGEVGGLMLVAAPTVVLDNCKIAFNEARLVGGIAILYSSLGYWGYPAEKNHVYMNKGGLAFDLYFEEYYDEYTTITIDTFTVDNPDSYMVYPPDKFQFIDGIDYGMIEQSDTDLYISEFGSDSNDGLTPESPLRSFEHALRKITSDTAYNNTLWVMPGHYYIPESESGSPIYLKNDVRIKATIPGEAILDGDSTCRVFYANSKNNYSLSALTIQNGYIEYAFGANFVSDVSGGGLFNIYSTGTIDSCDFISNYSKYYGGSAYLGGISTISFNYCEFLQNNAEAGGGVYLEGYCSVSFNNCIFEQNSAESIGGGISLAGNYNVNLDNCNFIQNTAESGGGGLFNYDDSSGPLNINNSLFSENHSGGDGGGLAYSGYQIGIKNTRFIANTSNTNGAGCYCKVTAQMPGFINCLFSRNISGNEGGGIYFRGITVSNLINCTFSDNQALSGSAVYQMDLYKLYSINSIFWNSEVPSLDLIHVKSTGNPLTTGFYINYSDIQGGEASIIAESDAGAHWEEGNITNYPAYVDPSNGDYSLNWNSPCIEAGKEDTTGLYLPDTDLNCDPRIINARIDMGAYEYQLPVNILTFQPEISNIKIYHDLPDEDLVIEFPLDFSDKSLSIRLISMEGLEITGKTKPQGTNLINLPVPEISSGIYLVTISDGGKVLHSRKIMITN
jgi:hypothetical protein